MDCDQLFIIMFSYDLGGVQSEHGVKSVDSSCPILMHYLYLHHRPISTPHTPTLPPLAIS